MMIRCNHFLFSATLFFCITTTIIIHANTGMIDTLKAPEFSVKRGFYTQTFDLVISSSIPGAVVKYTLDCSDPKTNSSALQQVSPVTIKIDPESTIGNRPKAPAVIVRACVTATGYVTSKSSTNTYLFVNKVPTLSPEGQKPASTWPTATSSANPQAIDYGMDPDVYNDYRYKELMDDALLAIPSISIATDIKNIFSLSTGIYMNAMLDGIDWERPTSVELLNPDASKGFQIDAGLRIRGGYSRHGENPKHAFRLFFRSEYGEGKLDYPLFDKEGTEKFDKVDLRTTQNYSWSYPGHLGQYNIMNREVFSRDMQREMGHPYTRSRYYHLYLNGVYWGLYQTQERSEAKYGESYLGGIADDYDVIQPDDSYRIEASNGNTDAYNSIWNLTVSGYSSNTNYFKLLGRNSDGTLNSSYKNLVDIDNLIDYMLIIFYTGNYDSPTSLFGGNNQPNNFFAIYNRNANEGFKFFAHDAEHSLRTTAGEGSGIGLYEDRVNIKMNVTNLYYFHPQWLHFRLTSNAEYKIKFADHIYKHFFNQGCLTPAKTTALFKSRVKEIELAIIAESARWGDTYSNPPRTKDKDWLPAVNDIINNYFPVRTGIVLNQLKTAGLYPAIDAPVFQNGTTVIGSAGIELQPGFKLKIQNPNNSTGTIMYTLDGSDPRAIGGAISSSAKDGNDEIDLSVTQTSILKARILNGTTWSALHEINLYSNYNLSDLKLTEIHYHPLDNGTISNSEYEFLELKNTGSVSLNLSQAKFIEGVNYTFPVGATIEPGKFIVLASNKTEFNNRYKFLPFGEYEGQLDNSGEKIVLVTAGGDTTFSIKYDDEIPWPLAADGVGNSLVPKEINPTGNLNEGANWRSSLEINGSPGKDDVKGSSAENNSANIPTEFLLNQNYPNPFNPTTIISWQIAQSSHVKLKVYDLLGREVATLVDEIKQPGTYNSQFPLKGSSDSMINSQFSSGVYLYTLRAGDFVSTKKMIFIK